MSDAVYIYVGFFLLVLAVLWFLLPFAVFGIKGRLDELLKETKRTNDLLQQQQNNPPR